MGNKFGRGEIADPEPQHKELVQDDIADQGKSGTFEKKKSLAPEPDPEVAEDATEENSNDESGPASAVETKPDENASGAAAPPETEIEAEKPSKSETDETGAAAAAAEEETAAVTEPAAKDDAGASAASEVTNGTDEKDEKSLVSTEFKWEQGGDTVILKCNFDEWKEHTLVKTDDVFSISLELPEGDHLYHYVVDNETKLDSNQPTEGDNNVVTVKKD